MFSTTAPTATTTPYNNNNNKTTTTLFLVLSQPNFDQVLTYPILHLASSLLSGSEDEVEYVDNEMKSYMASKPSGVGYGTKSLLEQWRKTYVNDDYDVYDDDIVRH
ncbi:hypothetical protein Tco_0339201 [Tanacetum coccineum]